jgi:hypothetical protein
MLSEQVPEADVVEAAARIGQEAVLHEIRALLDAVDLLAVVLHVGELEVRRDANDLRRLLVHRDDVGLAVAVAVEVEQPMLLQHLARLLLVVTGRG